MAVKPTEAGSWPHFSKLYDKRIQRSAPETTFVKFPQPLLWATSLLIWDLQQEMCFGMTEVKPYRSSNQMSGNCSDKRETGSQEAYFSQILVVVMRIAYTLLVTKKDRMGSRDVCLTNVCLEDIRAEGEERPVFLRWKIVEGNARKCTGDAVHQSKSPQDKAQKRKWNPGSPPSASLSQHTPDHFSYCQELNSCINSAPGGGFRMCLILAINFRRVWPEDRLQKHNGVGQDARMNNGLIYACDTCNNVRQEEENGNISFRNCEIPFFQSDGDLLQDLDGLLVVLQLGLDERRQLAHLFNLQANGGITPQLPGCDLAEYCPPSQQSQCCPMSFGGGMGPWVQGRSTIIQVSPMPTAFLFSSGLKWSLKMVPYQLHPETPTQSCKSRGSNLCVHVKNTLETAQAIESMHIQNANKIMSLYRICAIPLLQCWRWVHVTEKAATIAGASLQRPQNRDCHKSGVHKRTYGFSLEEVLHASSPKFANENILFSKSFTTEFSKEKLTHEPPRRKPHRPTALEP
ncbi:hypothetical protein GH733_018349 [Mirounga leonina]|nr:hypothetical protein GH733_018349 [Mirounga leonina]